MIVEEGRRVQDLQPSVGELICDFAEKSLGIAALKFREKDQRSAGLDAD